MTSGEPKIFADLPQVITVFPLDGALLLPHSQLPLNIFEPRYLDLVSDCMRTGQPFGVICLKQGSEANRNAPATLSLPELAPALTAVDTVEGAGSDIIDITLNPDTDPVARLRRLIEERQAESVEILRGWMEAEPEKT